MGVWVQILQTMQVEKKGVTTTLRPGDWWEFSRTHARDLVERGAAKATAPVALTAVETAGVAFVTPTASHDAVRAIAPHATVYADSDVDWLALMGAHTRIVWGVGRLVDAGHMAMGLNAVLTWDAAIPLVDYTVLACDVGDVEDRALTAALGIDLRVPLYSPELLFLRSGDVAHALIKAWSAGLTPTGDARLALLRAIWHVKPMLLPLPATWMGVRL